MQWVRVHKNCLRSSVRNADVRVVLVPSILTLGKQIVQMHVWDIKSATLIQEYKSVPTDMWLSASPKQMSQ